MVLGIMYRDLCRQDKYDTLSPTIYECIVCSKEVETETHIAYDKQGKEIIIYSPASRYWCNEGVFCGIDCSFKDHMERLNG